MFLIYKPECILNNKCYIGFTQNLKKRQGMHKSTAFTNNGKSKNKFHRALRKYGLDNFEWSIVFESWDRDYCLGIAENLIIRNYNSIQNGYNSVPGGSSSVGLYGPKNGMFGKTHTEEAKQIIRELRAKEKLDPEYSNKKMRANPRCMPVTDGINEYTSIGDAARQLNITMHKAQGMRRRGQLYQVGTEQVLRDSLPGTKEWADFRASKDKRSRPVTDGSNIFPSALSASRFYNVHPHVMHFILKNNKPHKKLHAELQYI